MIDRRLYYERVSKFQRLMGESNIDASMIRTLSSFTYFAGTKWLRPALLIPAEGKPEAFILKHEVEQFKKRTWITRIHPYTRVEELMGDVSKAIAKAKHSVLGFDYSVERDAYVLFFELFKKMNAQREIRDVHALIMKLRMIKDKPEIEAIKKSSVIAVKGMEAAVDAIRPGSTELDVAAEAIREMMKEGSENPHIYVNAGPNPRAHAEPRSWIRVEKGHTVNLVVSADYEGYNSNMARTVFVDGASDKQRDVLRTIINAYTIMEAKLRPRQELSYIEEEIKLEIERQGYRENYIAGFAHGVGLLTEEDPITTIVVPHRRYEIAENMVLAAIHSPLAVPGVGSVKCEDTFLIRKEKAENLTQFEYKIET